MGLPPHPSLRALIAAVQGGTQELVLRLDMADQGLSLALHAISPRLARDPEVLAILTGWRNRYRSAYLTQFTATEEGTARYLQQRVLGDPGMLLFLVAFEGRWVGQYGFRALTATDAELDALARTPDPLPPMVIRAAAGALCRWLLDEGRLDLLHGTVLRTNPAALLFNRGIGAQEVERTPHWAHPLDADRVELRPHPPVPGAPPEVELAAIRITRESLAHAFPALFTWPLVAEHPAAEPG
jgi:hypothetical protein